MTRALFLDRDGTLIVDVGYPRDPDRVALVPGVVEALRELQQQFALVIVSNQSGLARGKLTRAEADAVHARVVELFAAEGVQFAGARYCFHGPDDGCSCRKPAPGMLLDAAKTLELDVASSVMIGDKLSDVDAGRAAGCRTALLFGPEAPTTHSTATSCRDWTAIAALLADPPPTTTRTRR
ncbi:MAG: D-glycero-alpha-D-manno-heptose-1,7-bisphosphate 7-phosphatase [Kofleriaceae bacterium]